MEPTDASESPNRLWENEEPAPNKLAYCVAHLFVVLLGYVILVVWTSFGSNECPKK
jgi:hypothetical protein